LRTNNMAYGHRTDLTLADWAKVKQRYLNGESAAALAKELGVTQMVVKNHVAKDAAKIKAVAKVIHMEQQNETVKAALNELSIESQIMALDLAKTLRLISGNLAQAAMHSAQSANMYAGYARSYAQMVDPDAPLDVNREANRAFAEMQDLSVLAAKIPLGLLGASKDMLTKIPETELDEIERAMPTDPIEAARVYARLIGN
jgi:predicted transcriptional regulator